MFLTAIAAVKSPLLGQDKMLSKAFQRSLITNGPLNFNFLPHYADKKLAVLPHTVELYSLDDPGTDLRSDQNFNEMHRFYFECKPALETSRHLVSRGDLLGLLRH